MPLHARCRGVARRSVRAVITQRARTRVRLCGALGLEVDGRELAAALPEGQPAVLLAALLVDRERGVERDALVEVLWPRQRPRDPGSALRPVLSRLRRVIEPVSIEGRERVRIILPEPVWVDLDAAAADLAAARAALREHDPTAAAEHADAAIRRLGDGVLPDLDGTWLAAPRAHHEDLLLEALELRAQAAVELGGPELAAAERAGREIVARSPYRESGHRALMEALAAQGNVAEALRVYDELRVLLRDELGTAPAPALQALHSRLLAPEPSRASRLRRPPRTTLVGRRSELETLRTAWRRAVAGERTLVLVAGEPGIGKTRLVSELAREVDRSGTVLRASSQPDAVVAYQPWVEALRALTATVDLPHQAPGVLELSSGGAPAPDGDPETRRYLLFEAVAELLDDASARTPLLLVFDDLHWADRGTLHLLRHVARSGREPALLVVGTYRSTEVGAGHPLAELLADLRRERLFERITLDGLDVAQVGELIAAEAGREAASGVVAAVHAKTDGNPFFVQEVVRHLVETGALVVRGGVMGGALRADDIGVPEGVAEVLASRLARLSSACRDVLAGAAVLGRRFDFATLAALNEDEDEVLSALEEALAAHLVVDAEADFAFRHALVRETLYRALSTPRRQRLHARAARAIEATHGQGSLAALATHERLAGPAGDRRRAIEFSLRAGEQARQLSAWEEAAAHWDGALLAMESTGAMVEERARLLVALGKLMVVAGDTGRHIAYLERALALYEALGDEEHAAHAHSRLGTAYALIDSIYGEHLDIGRAFRHFDAARPVLARGPVRGALGHLENGVAIARVYALDNPGGIEAAARAMEIGERLGDDVLWATAAITYGWHAIVSGRLREGLDIVEQAFAVADRERRPFVAWMSSNTRGQLTWGLGAPDEAQAYFERPLRLPYVGHTSYRHEIADGVGRCHCSRGEIDAARRLVTDARPTWITHSLKPLLDLYDGRLDEVTRLADDVLETSRRTGNRWDEWAAHHLAARADARRGNHDLAIRRLEEGLAIVVDGGAKYFELWVRADLVHALVAAGRVSEAGEHLRLCQAITGNGEDWRARAGHVLLAEAAVTAASSGPEAAEPLLARAQEIFSRYRLAGTDVDIPHAVVRS
jgi:DNA-binding SARP family transcriptional activator/tetratricopeptide (TPR) repeat protein